MLATYLDAGTGGLLQPGGAMAGPYWAIYWRTPAYGTILFHCSTTGGGGSGTCPHVILYPPPTTPGGVEERDRGELAQRVNRFFAGARRSQAGDWAGYGQALPALEEVWEELAEAEGEVTESSAGREYVT